MAQVNPFGTRQYTPTIADTHARVQLTNTHPNHRDEITAQLNNKGYVMPVAHQTAKNKVCIKFDRRENESDGEILAIHPKWLTVLDTPRPPDGIDEPAPAVDTLTPGYYQFGTRASYPRFVHVHDNGTTCTVRSTVTTLEQTEYSTDHLESWLNRWTATPVHPDDTPFNN